MSEEPAALIPSFTHSLIHFGGGDRTAAALPRSWIASEILLHFKALWKTMGGSPIFCLWHGKNCTDGDGLAATAGIDALGLRLRVRGFRALGQGQALARVHRQARRHQRGRLRDGQQSPL